MLKTIEVTYEVTDAGGLTDTATFNIIIAGTNDSPELVGNADPKHTFVAKDEDTTFNITVNDLLKGYSDVDKDI